MAGFPGENNIVDDFAPPGSRRGPLPGVLYYETLPQRGYLHSYGNLIGAAPCIFKSE